MKLKDRIKTSFSDANYFSEMERRTVIYEQLYQASPKKAVIRILWWNFKEFFKKQIPAYGEPNNSTTYFDDRKVNVVFELTGGMGDRVIAANYIAAFQARFGADTVNIDLVTREGNGDHAIFREGYIINRVFFGQNVPYQKLQEESDLWLKMERHIEIKHKNFARLSQLEPALIDYVFEIEKYQAMYAPAFDKSGNTYDLRKTKIDMLLGKKRMQQADVNGFLRIDETPLYHLPMDESDAFLETLGLRTKQFITVHRGSDVNLSKDNNKLWAHDNYVALIGLLKKNYPDIQIVQLGVSKDRCDAMDGVDLNLVGKTTMEQVKLLLKHALVHVDGEGGMVHIRHMLSGGPSIVLFGPTPLDFYGYDENINIRGTGCPAWCEWSIFGWHQSCAKGLKQPDCMKNITPDCVFEAFQNFYEQRNCDERNKSCV